MCGPEVREAWGCNGESAETQQQGSQYATRLTQTLECNHDAAAHAQEFSRASTLMRSGSVESKIHSDQQNLSSTQQSLQSAPAERSARKLQGLPEKQPLLRLEKTKENQKPTAYYSHEKHDGDILSKSRLMPAVSVLDQRCSNMGHGWESQRVLKEAGDWSQVPTEAGTKAKINKAHTRTEQH